jgi:hypothetical protein
MEFIVVLLFFGLVMAVSFVGTSREIKREQLAAQWVVQPNSGGGSFNPVALTNNSEKELSDYSTLYTELATANEVQAFNEQVTMPETTFEHSQVSNEVFSILDGLATEIQEHNKVQHELNEDYYYAIVEAIGPKTADLVSNTYSDLIENQLAVIFGLVDHDSHSISFNEDVLELTGAELVVSGKDDYVVIKGMLLPDRTFRVLHFEDAETVELGYATEQSFSITQIA